MVEDACHGDVTREWYGRSCHGEDIEERYGRPPHGDDIQNGRGGPVMISNTILILHPMEDKSTYGQTGNVTQDAQHMTGNR